MKSNKSEQLVRYVGIILASLAIIVIGFGHLFENHGFNIENLINSLWANVGAELASIALTVLVIDALNERRSELREKRDLIAQLSADDNGIARHAIKTLWSRGWLQDGTIRGASLWGANLEKANLGECDLRDTNLWAANLRGTDLWTDLRGANLKDADLAHARLSHPRYGSVQFNEDTILPNGDKWHIEVDMDQFIDPYHPQFWRSKDTRSPASEKIT